MSDVAAAQAEIERWLVRAEQAPESKAFAPLADAYRAAGRQQDAVRVLELGLQRYPDYVSGLVLLGLCWREMHEDERAESVFARVLELDPDNLVALRHRAECARRRGVPERAAEYLRRALAIDPFDRDVQADLGLVTTTLERQARERRDAAPPAAGVARPHAPRVVAAPPGAAARIPYPTAVPDADVPAAAAPAAADPFALPAAPAQPAPAARAATPPLPPEPAASPPSPPRTPLGPPPVESASPAPAAPAAERAPAAVPAPPPPSDVRGRPAVEPPSIDLRRVGRGEPVPAAVPEVTPPAPAVAPPPAVPSEPKPDAAPSWRYTREADRIVVAPSDTPVRGPIRSVEDRLFSEQRPLSGATQPPVGPSPVVPTPEAAAAAPGAPTGEFATITLARIYESQGYLQKAAGIYEALQRQRPDDPEIAQRLMALRRRQSGAADPAPAIVPPPAPAPPLAPSPPPAPAAAAPAPPSRPAAAVAPSPPVPMPPRPEEERGVAWRLLDPGQLGDPTETARRLRSVTEAARGQEQSRHHTVVGAPPPPAPLLPPPVAAPPEDLSRGHEDYQRFLSYLRSLRP